jgi:hypothetical protein
MAVGLGPLLAEASASAEERRLLLGAGLTNLGEMDKGSSSRRQAAGIGRGGAGRASEAGAVRHDSKAAGQ